MCVRGSPGVRNKLGLWLDSSIWKSLAAGSKRDIQMVSSLIADDPPNSHCRCNTVQIETHWMQSRRKNERQHEKVTLNQEAKIQHAARMETIATAFATKHVNIARQDNCSNNGTMNWK